jgi:hypothetical protein
MGKGKGKGKVFHVYAKKAFTGRRAINPLIIIHDARWR